MCESLRCSHSCVINIVPVWSDPNISCPMYKTYRSVDMVHSRQRLYLLHHQQHHWMGAQLTVAAPPVRCSELCSRPIEDSQLRQPHSHSNSCLRSLAEQWYWLLLNRWVVDPEWDTIQLLLESLWLDLCAWFPLNLRSNFHRNARKHIPNKCVNVPPKEN